MIVDRLPLNETSILIAPSLPVTHGRRQHKKCMAIRFKNNNVLGTWHTLTAPMIAKDLLIVSHRRNNSISPTPP